MKKLIRTAVCLAATAFFAIGETFAVAAFEYTDYGNYPASTAPTRYSVGWFNPEGYTGYKKHGNYFEIQTTVNGNGMSFYLTLPDMGGFRLTNEKPEEKPKSVEKTGVWEPKSNLKIAYTSVSGEISMQAKDETRICFSEKGDSWILNVYDGENIKLLSITPQQISCGFQKEKLVKMKLELPLAQKEVLYGSGERFSGLNLVGKKTTMWNSDAAYHGKSTGTGEDGINSLWRGYKNVPVFHSNRGYSLFYNSYCAGEIDAGYTNSKKYSLDFSDPRMDFYLWAGSVSENLVKYTDLTGKSYLPPKWAFQYQAGGSNGFWGVGDSNANQLVVAQRLIDCYEELGTPLNAVYIEGVNSGNNAVYNMLRAAGARLLQWNNADCISVKGAADYFGDLPSRQLPYARNAKNPIQTVGDWVDYTDPNGLSLLKYVKSTTAAWGIVGGMCDFAELVPSNTVFSNGLTGEKMHNFYTYFYGKAYNKVMGELTDNDWFCYIRGASAGTQKWIGTWSGDQYNTWAGLKMQLSAGLSIGTSGFSIWGTDMGGLDGKISDDMYNRALIFGLFMPTMRTGGSVSKLPTEYSGQVQNTFKQAYWLREALANKLYSSAVDSHETGLPLMQAMGLAFPDELSLYEIEHEYLFCDDFLVSTVFRDKAYYSDEVVLPEGTWYSLWNGEPQSGGKTVSAAAPYNQMPVYVKSGAAVPLTLNGSLEICEPVNDNKTEALLVTPPDEMRSSVYNKTADEFTAYVSAPVSKDTFRIKAGEGNEATCILALGVPAYSVKVDGKYLNRLKSKPSDASAVGYYVDSEYRTSIYIGTANWKEIDICIGKMTDSPKNLISAFTDSRASEKLLNESFSDTYSFGVANDNMLTAVLSKKADIDRLVLKWTAAYADSYNIEASEDGENWSTVKTVEASLGGIETVMLENAKGKYLRISDVETIGNGIDEPTLYGVYAYAGTAGTAVVDKSDDSSYSSDEIKTDENIEDEYDETVVIRKRRKKKTNNDGNTVFGMSPWLFTAVCGVTVGIITAGGIIIILLLKRKKGKTQQIKL